jgi:hypothetical protein
MVWNIDALFFMVGWAQCTSRKNHTKTHYAELVFLHLVRSAAHVVRSGVFRALNVDTLFFMLGWARCGSQRIPVWSCYGEHVFLHLVPSVGHVVHLGVSRS